MQKKKIKTKYIVYLIILVVACIFGSQIDGFFTATNILNVTRQASTIAICALAMTLVLIIQGIDLGTGGVMAFCAMISGFMMLNGIPVFLCMLCGAGVGLLIGVLNGILVSKVEIPPFVATYVTGQITLGLALVVGQGSALSGLPDDYVWIGNSTFLAIPINTWIMIVLLIVTSVILKYTRMGKHIYALGGNENVVKTEGINPGNIKIFAFALCGLYSAIAGILLSAQIATVHPTEGASYQLDAVAASLVGGVSMLGGEGKARMSVLGALIIGFLRNALDMKAIDPFYQNLFIGLAIILVVGVSVHNKNKELAAAKVF